MAGRRLALIVANDAYDDPKLRRLRAPAQDAEALGRLLRDPEVGAFEVEVSVNQPEARLRRQLSRFFAERARDDLLLLHFSCHGLKDDDGRLYFAAADTEVQHLAATGVSSEFVSQLMGQSRSRRVVLLLDCCYSGAFAGGMSPRAGEGVEIAERFEGRGRVILTASSAMEYAFEGDELSGHGQPSIFTSALVHGLETGDADRDHDQLVSVDDLYDYVYERVREATPNQTPRKWTFDVEGELYIARSAHPAALPPELEAALASPLKGVREGAVGELEALLASPSDALAALAHATLERLAADDDSHRVRHAAHCATGHNVPPTVGPPDAPARAAVTAGSPTAAGAGAPSARPGHRPAASDPPAAPPAQPPPDTPGRARRPGLLALAAAVLALAVAGAAGVVLGGSGGEPPPPGPGNTEDIVPVKSTHTPEPTPEPSPEPTPEPPADEPYATYRAGDYEIDYPEPWTITRDDELVNDEYFESRFEDPDGSAFALVNRIPGEGTSPADKAAEVEAGLRSVTPSYRRLSFHPVTIAGRRAFKWTFEQRTEGRRERRVDYFLNLGGDGYAVLGGGSRTLDPVLGITRRMAESLSPR